MAAPTQEYPSWLTPSVDVFTNADGVLTSSTTVLFLPLTYYGPSIPLGADFTYGGLTSPASTVTATTTTAQPTTTTNAPSATPSSSITPTPSSSMSSSVPSSTSSLSPTQTPGSTRHLSRGQLIGVIVASVLGALTLLILLYCFYEWWKNRRVRNAFKDDSGDFVFVRAPTPPTPRTPGEGSPRHSGDERDSFLQRSRKAPEMAELGVVAGASGAAGTGETRDSGSSQSSYGVVLDRPSLRQAMDGSRHRTGHILSPDEQRLLDSAVVDTVPDEPFEPEKQTLMPPPRLVDPETASHIHKRSLPLAQRSFHSNRSSLPLDVDEAGQLQTAQRVNVQNLGPRSSQQATASDPSPSSEKRQSWIPLLGRLLKGDSPSGSRRSSQVPPSAWTGHGMRENDVESGRALLTAPSAELRSARGVVGVGLGPGGERPHSGAQSSMNSARSGASNGTVYYDAMSSVPDLPAPVARQISNQSMPRTRTGTPVNETIPEVTESAQSIASVDMLDMPAPQQLRSFASVSSLRDTATTNSSSVNSKKNPAFPPGLPFFNVPKTWTEISGETPSPGTYDGGNAGNMRTSVTIDVLEDAPPHAQHDWSHHLAGVTVPTATQDSGRRTTFGAGMPQFGHSPEHSSERGSLHSMRSHLSPAHSRSAGSAPSSHGQDSSMGSGSSKPSRRTGSSSLSHSGSISSDGRRRGKLGSTGRSGALSPTPMSPPLSAVGERPGSVSPLRAQSPEMRAMSPTSLSGVPWATGLERDWNPS